MRKHILFATTALVSGLCFAQDVGQVLSATAILQQVAVPRQVCSIEQVAIQRPNSGAGAAMGAIAGGALGNASGHGAGQAAATMIGIIGGAVLGDRIEGSPTPQVQDVQRCAMQTRYENRIVGYNVVYEFAGKRYTVQMPQNPGPTIQLQVSPVGADASAMAQYDSSMGNPIVYAQPAPVVVMQTATPLYYDPQPYYPPFSVNLGFGYWGGHRGHGYRH